MMNIDLLTTLTIVSDYLVMIVSVWMAMYMVGRGYPDRIAVRAIVVLLAIAFYSYDAITRTLDPAGTNRAVQQVTIMIALVGGFHFVHSLLPESHWGYYSKFLGES